MNFEEFLKSEDASAGQAEPASSAGAAETAEDVTDDIDVQKAVVESLAADKVAQDEKIAALTAEKERLSAALDATRKENESLKARLESLRDELAKAADALANGAEVPLSSKISILERDGDVPDRFEGETRDHVLEAVAAAREKAEADGRRRCAQLLVGVLVANEKAGLLEKKRRAVEKLFADNGNILSGPVIAELQRLGISHKNGEEYLLPDEIIKRTF